MTITAHHQSPLPTLPAAIIDAELTKEILHNLRHFHLGNPEVREQLEAVPGECLPALLDPFRESSRLRYEYPLFLSPISSHDEAINATDLASPLSRFLLERVGEFAPGKESARILKDNLPWLERDLRRQLEADDQSEGPQEALPLIESAAGRLVEQLALEGENGEKLQADLERLIAAIPRGGKLLGYGIYPAIHLLIHVIHTLATPRRRHFHTEVNEHIHQLSRLLEVEREKSMEAIEPASIQGSTGLAGNLLNSNALSAIMDHSRGSVAMPAERKARIEQALETLKAYQDNPVEVHFIHNSDIYDEQWLKENPYFHAVEDSDPCARATRYFDDEAEKLAKVFIAARIARLEADDLYDPAIHDPWFATFNWEAFSKDEILMVPAIVALEGAHHVAGSGMPSFSRLLSSGRPVQVLIRIQAHHNPGADIDDDPFHSYRTELGYLGISHRKAFIAQSSAARHNHLLAGYLDALEATRTSLHLVSTGLRTAGTETSLNAWLVAGAGLEARVHPFFRINPGLGDSSAERMDFSSNPQPERDWPINPFRYQDESGLTVEGELAFTFADYALLMPKFGHHFARVPANCDAESLLPVADFLKLPQARALNYLPFVWGVDKYGTLIRFVISRTLVHACRDRLNFWRTLQEMAGVNNRYVTLAEEQTRKIITAEFEQQQAALLASHDEALSAARSEAAGEVMGRLTEVLMGMDMTAARPRPGSLSGTTGRSESESTTAATTATEAPPAATEEEELSFDEPWIDSPLCTSCNDCLAINPIMFVYDDNNQAIITDISTGTFAQLVEAAELCPSKCIHPGKPTNPNEAFLDDLIERAAPFN